MIKASSLLLLSLCLFDNLVVAKLTCKGSLSLETVAATTYTTKAGDTLLTKKSAGDKLCVICVEYQFEVSCKETLEWDKTDEFKGTLNVLQPSGKVAFYHQDSAGCQKTVSLNSLKNVIDQLKFIEPVPNKYDIFGFDFSNDKPVSSVKTSSDKSKGATTTYYSDFEFTIARVDERVKEITIEPVLGNAPVTHKDVPEGILRTSVGECSEKVIQDTTIAPQINFIITRKRFIDGQLQI
jgi:hypothetical protein